MIIQRLCKCSTWWWILIYERGYITFFSQKKRFQTQNHFCAFKSRIHMISVYLRWEMSYAYGWWTNSCATWDSSTRQFMGCWLQPICAGLKKIQLETTLNETKVSASQKKTKTPVTNILNPQEISRNTVVQFHFSSHLYFKARLSRLPWRTSPIPDAPRVAANLYHGIAIFSSKAGQFRRISRRQANLGSEVAILCLNRFILTNMNLSRIIILTWRYPMPSATYYFESISFDLLENSSGTVPVSHLNATSKNNNTCSA